MCFGCYEDDIRDGAEWMKCPHSHWLHVEGSYQSHYCPYCIVTCLLIQLCCWMAGHHYLPLLYNTVTIATQSGDFVNIAKILQVMPYCI